VTEALQVFNTVNPKATASTAAVDTSCHDDADVYPSTPAFSHSVDPYAAAPVDCSLSPRKKQKKSYIPTADPAPPSPPAESAVVEDGNPHSLVASTPATVAEVCVHGIQPCLLPMTHPLTWIQVIDDDVASLDDTIENPDKGENQSMLMIPAQAVEVFFNMEWWPATADMVVRAGMRYRFRDGSLTVVRLDEVPRRVRTPSSGGGAPSQSGVSRLVDVLMAWKQLCMRVWDWCCECLVFVSDLPDSERSAGCESVRQ
jgi:hypothetical protein